MRTSNVFLDNHNPRNSMFKLLISLLIVVASFGQAQETKNPTPTPVIVPTDTHPEKNPVQHVVDFHPERSAFPEDDTETMKSEPDNFFSQLSSMVMTLGILLALILFFTWLLKRLLNTRVEEINQKSPIKVLQSRNISPKTAIHVVDVFGKNYVIAESVNGVTHLGDVDVPTKPDFQKMMQNNS